MLYRERVGTAVRLSRAPEASLIASIPPTLARPEWSQSVDFVSVNGRSSSAGSSDEDSHGDLSTFGLVRMRAGVATARKSL